MHRPWHFLVEDLLAMDQLSSLPRGGLRAMFAALPPSQQVHYTGLAMSEFAAKCRRLFLDPFKLLAADTVDASPVV